MMANGRIVLGQLRKLIDLTSSKSTLPLFSRVTVAGVSTPRCLLQALSSSRSYSQQNQNDGETSQSSESSGQPNDNQTQAEAEFVSGNQSSSEDSHEQEYEYTVRQQILKASMPHVHEFGWTKKALEAGAKSEGLPPVAQGMFPRGGADLVHYFIAQCNTDLGDILTQQAAQAAEEGLEKPRGKVLIRDAVETRLRMITPYLDQWTQAMAIQTLPQNAPEAWRNLLNLADEIWYHAGDRSTDFNWYTKRLALAGVYKSSEIFMLQDKSEDQQDTWAFVDRRLEDFQKFGAAKKSCEQSCDVLAEGLKGVLIMGQNMLGANSRNR